MIRGYHVYKDIWTDPDYDEELECVREPGNSSDPLAVAVKKEISGDAVVVGHVPRSISPICSIFIRRGGIITSRANGHRCYSEDLPQGGLEIPCVFTFSTKSHKEANKTSRLLESTLSITIKMDSLAINDGDCVASEAGAKGRSSPQQPAISALEIVADKGSTFDHELTCMSKGGKCVVDLSDMSDKTPAAYLEAGNLPQKKRVKLIDTEPIIMGKELSDVEINLAQELLKNQFPDFNGLQSTLLQEKKTLLTEKSVRNKVQIIHCKGRHHWAVVSTVCCHLGEVKVYDSLFTYCDKETEKVIFNLFQWNSTKVTVKFARCQKQVGGVDCGLFAIAFATAIVFGKPPNKFKLIQQELRSHLINCFNKGKMSLFPCK